MATLKDIRRRIRSVQSTQQITKAMEMVAAAKLRRAQERSLSARPYAAKMTAILRSLSSAAGERDHPLFEVRTVEKRTLVVLASDKGLCGSFNTNVFREAEHSLHDAAREVTDVIGVGKRATAYFSKRGWTSSLTIPELGDQVDLVRAQVLARHVVELYEHAATDQVDFLFTRFVSTAKRQIILEKFLPIAPDALSEQEAGRRSNDYIFEPDAERVFSGLLPRYVQTKVMSAMADSLASEHAARLVSMSAATKNAGDMISNLTLIRNKLRQAAITKEISELVGGAEALK